MNGKFRRGLAPDRERRHARRAGRGPVQQLPRQVAGLAVPAHRPGLPLPDVRRRPVVEEMAPTLGKFYVKAGARREPRAVGQLQGRLPGQRAGAGGPRPVRRQPALRVRSARPASASSASRSTASPPSPARWRAARSSAAPAARCTSCVNQDILVGSERVRIESCATRIPARHGVVNLRPGARLRHRLPAGPHAADRAAVVDRDDNLLVRSGLSGDEAYLVVRYEYTPGFDELDALATGGAGATSGSTTTSRSA